MPWDQPPMDGNKSAARTNCCNNSKGQLRMKLLLANNSITMGLGVHPIEILDWLLQCYNVKKLKISIIQYR